jgi:murein L,D-transpeptidase YcbB/YkuD
VPPGPKLQRGDRDPRVADLRARLLWGRSPAPPPAPEPGLFDADLEAEVRDFQATHGLDPDGVVGRRTLAALDVTAAARARQVAVNLERLRWLPRDLGARRVVVNIPDFRLEVFEGGAPVLGMRVIAGRDARRTPFFAGEITAVVVNPTWTIPLKIALEDKLPLILEDRDWLAEQGVRVYRREGDAWRAAAPGEVQWVTLGPGNFPYRLVQEPGPKNALGRLKFLIPNPHDIYLHDTPARELFSRADRSFSSGCIRVERPRDLAELLLRPDPAWSRPAIDAAIARGETRQVPLRTPVPVYLLYWTAWVDDRGILQLREDIYGRDEEVAADVGWER